MTQTPWGAGQPAYPAQNQGWGGPPAQQYPPAQQSQNWGGGQPQQPAQQINPGHAADQDPFAKQESVPSLSFNNAPVGASYTGTVVSHPTMLQTRDFKTKQPESWPDGNPKMAAVFNVQLENGEVRAVWARRPGGLFSAIAEAQERAGARIAPGGRILIRFTGYGQATAGNDPPKTYEAQYEPGNAFGGPAPGPAAPSPQQPAQGQQQWQGQRSQGYPPADVTGVPWQQSGAPAGQGQSVYPPAQQQPGQQWAQAQQQAGNPTGAGAAALAYQQAQQQPPAQAPQGGPEWFAGGQQAPAPQQPAQGPQQPAQGGGYTDAQIAAARAAGIALPGL